MPQLYTSGTQDMTKNKPLPTDNDVRCVLRISRQSRDPRTAPAFSLILGYTCTAAELLRFRWPHLDLRQGTLLRKGQDGHSLQHLTELVVRQLLAISRSSCCGQIFGPTERFPRTLKALLSSTLTDAGLGTFTPIDFVRWSRLQSPQIKRSVVTAS